MRVLDLEGTYITRLDSAIGDLVHLRYLGFRGTWLKKLPSSVHQLLNLQTQDLRSTFVNPFPTAILRLQQLKHSYFNDLQMMVLIPFTDTYLSNLQTLVGLYFGETSTSIDSGLNKLTNLMSIRIMWPSKYARRTIG